MENKKLERAKNDIFAGLGFLIFALIFFLETFHFKRGNPNVISLTVFPRIIGGLIGACALVMIVRGCLAYRKISNEVRTRTAENKKKTDGGALRVFEVFVVMIATWLAMRPLGFILTMPVAMFALFIILEKPGKRNYLLYIVASVISPILIYFAFYRFFSSLLPMGILQPVLAQIL